MKQRVLSLILTLCMLFSLVVILPTTAGAVSQQDAVSWLRSQDGKYYDLDGYYGAQCSDFASAYMNWLITGNPWSGTYGVYDANYYPTVASWNTNRWEVIRYSSSFIPQPGDIFVTSGAYGNYGHVGAVISSGAQTATIIDQNSRSVSLTNGSSAWLHDISWSGAYTPQYFIRYKGLPGNVAAPTGTWMTTSSETGNSSTTITLNWGANGADKYWLGIYRNGVSENELYISKQLTSTSFSQTFPSGTYYAVIAAINSGGETKASVSFKITENGSLKNVAVSDGLYILESKLDSNKAADVYSGSKDSETNIELWAKNNKNNQKFKIEKDGNSYKIAAYHSGLSMDVRGGSAASGTNIQQYRFCEDNNLAQKWVFEDAGNGYVYIRSMLGTYVDIYSGLTDDGTNIWAFSFNGTDAQKWKLVPTSCAHTYGNWSVTKSASCTESGTETRICSLCQKTETRTINALGHSYSNGVCSKCGERENTNTPVTPNPPVSPDSGKKEVHFPKITIYFQGQFSDVPTDQWFTNNVANAFSLGLMKGNSATTFNPYGDVTIAEAVAMAARIHSIYTTGSENFTQGTPWYQCYLDYAYKNKIISYAYYNCDVKHKATRAQFAEIFAAALPDEALSIKNSVSDNAIPDVKMKDSYSAPVYKLYRAGILAGGDAKGTFSPGTFITRAECATIVARMADSDNRVSFSLT